MYSDAESKARFYRERYTAIQQRTARFKLFTPTVVVGGTPIDQDGDAPEKKYQLKTIDYLLGTTGKLSNVIVLGALCQLKHNKYSLEDPTGLVDLDLSEAKFHRGLYTENCFVLVEGWYEDLVFHVVAMGHPPIEKSEVSRSVFGTLNYFGGPLEVSPKCSNQLLHLEQSDDSAMMVFVSDLWLDKPQVLQKFNQLLAGYSSMPPTAFVLMGNFLSATQTSGVSRQADELKDHLGQLAEMIAEYPELCSKSRFVIVPGPQDPGFPVVFPRPALSEYVTKDFRKKVPNAFFASNPCRIQYCTQEIVVFREDIVTKICRNCVYFPESGDIPSHFSRTILSQGHLAPLPLHVIPTYWDHDRAMWIYPLPDLVVVGDKFDPFTTSQDGCNIINPGSFFKNEFSFKTYIMKTKTVEDSQIPDDDE